MSNMDDTGSGGPTSRLAAFAAVVSLVGLADSVYLTIKHLTAGTVPCSIIEGCEQVLSSPYSEIWGVPIAALGAAAYFVAFSLTTLSAFGNPFAWRIFSAIAVMMTVASLWLIYLQWMVIGAFCQFCLLSAATSIILFLTAVVSYLISRRS